MRPLDIAVATREDATWLAEHLPIGGMPAAHLQRILLQLEGKALYLIAWQARRPVGHVLLHFRHPAHHASCRYCPECAYAEGLNVHPDMQRHGIATSLMRDAESRARQHRAETIGLSVGVDNAPAQALYRKLGYRHAAAIQPYQVTWNYRDKVTGEIKAEGERCAFWMKPLA
jgi:GNAT superfamily N-acetyltransferase